MCGLCVLGSEALAAEPFAKAGYGATWLTFPRGVRNVGMGATGTADVSGSATGYFNPAGVAWSDATTLVGSYEDLYLDMNLSEALVTSPIPFHDDSTAGAWRFGGAFGYSRLGMEAQVERTIFLPEGTGRVTDLDDWMLSSVGALSWSQGVMSLGAGATGKFIQSERSTGNVTTWALDLGVIAAFPVDVGGGRIRPRLGYSILNLDSGTEDDARTFYVANEQRGGFGFDFETPAVLVAKRRVPGVKLSLDYDRIDREANSTREYSAGFEISIIDLLHVRYGAVDSDYATYGVGLGWDYGHVLFRADYAHTEFDGSEYWLDLDRDTYGASVGVRW
jgi:hypothetical protein